MEEFFKSALLSQDSFVLEDSSLALPEQNLRSSTEVNAKDRSLRVHQQVKLTLARRARNTVSNGNIQLKFFLCKMAVSLDRNRLFAGLQVYGLILNNRERFSNVLNGY